MSAIAQHKVVLIGDYMVGKTTMFLRYKTGEYPGEIDERTKRESEITKQIMVDGKLVELTLHDTAGMERFEGTVPPSYFRCASAVVFVYALDNQESIANIDNWADSVTPQRLGFVQTDVDIVRALVGNKSDLEDERSVSKQRSREVAENCGVKPELTLEISALTGEGFDELFVAVAREILSKGKKSGEEGGVKLEGTRRKKSGISGSGCCS